MYVCVCVRVNACNELIHVSNVCVCVCEYVCVKARNGLIHVSCVCVCV